MVALRMRVTFYASGQPIDPDIHLRRLCQQSELYLSGGGSGLGLLGPLHRERQLARLRWRRAQPFTSTRRGEPEHADSKYNPGYRVHPPHHAAPSCMYITRRRNCPILVCPYEKAFEVLAAATLALFPRGRGQGVRVLSVSLKLLTR